MGSLCQSIVARVHYFKPRRDETKAAMNRQALRSLSSNARRTCSLRGARAVTDSVGVHTRRRNAARSQRKSERGRRTEAKSSGDNHDDVSTTATAESGKPEEEKNTFFEEYKPMLKTASIPPWKAISPGTVLCMEIGDAVSESASSGNPFVKEKTLPRIVSNMKKAAADPRICGLYLKITPLACGYGKICELRRQIEEFRKSGKFTIAYFELGGMKEYLLGSACEELYVPPEAYFSLTGVVIENSFLRGVLEKIGIEPQVQRIGKYKSAGDQLLRKDMSDAQRTVSERLVESIYSYFTDSISKDKGKTKEEVVELMNTGPHKVEDLAKNGWLTSTKYLNEIEDLLKPRTGGSKDVMQSVGFSKYLKTPESKLLKTNPKNTIAVIRSAGAISREASGVSSGIASTTFIKSIKRVMKDKSVKAVVLRIDSPGGDALASDLMWNEIRQLSKLKPVVASMVDVAASGGFYMSMACDKIVEEPLTLTGSIGVVTGKFNLEELNSKIGYNTKSGSFPIDLLRNSANLLSNVAQFYSTVQMLSEQRVGYDASIPSFKIKDGSTGFDSKRGGLF